jgi:hypothetical protein
MSAGSESQDFQDVEDALGDVQGRIRGKRRKEDTDKK